MEERPEPFGAIIGDYIWHDATSDAAVLRNLAVQVAAAHIPFLSGAGAEFFAPTHGKVPSEIWLALRDAHESRYIFLAGTRVLARTPRDPQGTEAYCWTNAAYLVGEALVGAVLRDGSGAGIDAPDGLVHVDGLVIHPDVNTNRPSGTEVPVNPKLAKDLAKLGLMPLSTGSGKVGTFYGLGSVNRPPHFDRPMAAHNARISVLLPYISVVNALLLPMMVQARDGLRRGLAADELEMQLRRWLSGLCMARNLGDEALAFPLWDSNVQVLEDPARPGKYRLGAYIAPRMPMHDLNISMRVMAKVPDPKARLSSPEAPPFSAGHGAQS